MKKKFFSVLSLLVSSVLITSCSIGQVEFKPLEDFLIDNDNNEMILGDNYYKPASYKPIKYLNENNVQESVSDFNEVYRSRNYNTNISSTGEQKIIVVPIDFEDYPYTNLGYDKKQSKAIIENSFFGDDSTSNFYSVSSFYNKSSYGKLKLSGFVTDWYRCNLSAEELSTKTNKNVIRDIYNDSLKWIKTKYDNLDEYYIDGNSRLGIPIYFVYSAPTNFNDNKDIFWAYTLIQQTPISWSSFDTINLSSSKKTDPHTFIHETGHLFGLTDYYPDSSITSYSPTGHIDMMDYSLGDHTGYSKMLLNWTRPYYIKGKTTINISPFAFKGDLILLNDLWNGSAMDEYLLLEFYTPNGLNYFDYKNGNQMAKLPSKPGIKIYHVDSRLGFFKNDIVPVGYVEDGGFNKTDYRISMMHSNTVNNNSEYASFPLYHLLEKSGDNTFKDGNCASNNTLFYEGDTFGVDTFKDFTFNDGTKLNYSITIDSITNSSATISFSKN